MDTKGIMKKVVIGGISVLLAVSEPVFSISAISKAAAQTQTITTVITLNLNGGTLPTDATLTFDSMTDTILPVPTKTGYSFGGWYDNEYFSGTAVSLLPAGSVQNAVTYYAKWIPVCYSIQFKTNGGVIEGEIPEQYVIGTEIQLPNKVTRENYSFAGWYDNPEYTGEPCTSICKSDVGNRIFYAKWEIKGYKVTLNLNGGALPDGTDLTFEIGTQVVLPIPTKENYIFSGWYDNPDFAGTPISIITETDYGDRSLYAKWLPNECKIILNLNGGNLSEGTEIVHNPGTDTRLPIPIYPGFTFEGWYLTENFSGEAVSVIPADASGEINYYAKWSLESPQQPQTVSKKKVLKTGTLATIGKTTYKVSSSKKRTVTFIESYHANIIIPDTVRLSGITYKVTRIAPKACKLNSKIKEIVIGKNVKAIGKYAFDGCRSLKKITIKSTSLNAVGKKALRGISNKCCICVPESKINTYMKLFKGKGQANTVKIKKF